ncbi:hypothetical protein Ahy_A01g003044 [Arachis hypogaea]|uniref:SWIM-type domain-containing protein n=1 Tax=Arachis hypogaea TaxID=3818 RepID=A0A445ESH7_ARAHY|nr:hypothetical protein Ahy_A01g003044 [Arachis hypogaea]
MKSKDANKYLGGFGQSHMHLQILAPNSCSLTIIDYYLNLSIFFVQICIGMPCMHAIAAIQDKNDKRLKEYCHEWLRMDSYRKTY